MRSSSTLCGGLLTLTNVLHIDALSLNINSPPSIINATSSIAQGLLGQYYNTQPGQPIGIFQGNSIWGESGAAWASLIDYWGYTGHTEYNDVVQQALLAQAGPNSNFMPANQTKSEGNSDQGLWALATMTAAELQLPNPPASPSWLQIAQNVFDLQAARWDNSSCGGGLRWQIFTFNSGYNYKNAISTGVFFQLAARLAKFTGNQTYADWAEKSYDWTSSVDLIDSQYRVYDGASTTQDCSSPNRLEWTYDAATFLYGSAVMYNFTNGNQQWHNRTSSLLSAMSVFTSSNSSSNTTVSSGALVEVACEPQHTCANDQYAFKGVAAQWMGATLQIAPFTASGIVPYLQQSASGAAAACVTSSNGIACGSQWTTGKSDNNLGFGQQLSALNVILANLAVNAPVPVTTNTTTVKTNLPSASSKAFTGISSPTTHSSSRHVAGLSIFLVVALAFLF